MEPAKYNLTLYRQRDFCKDFTFVDEEGELVPIDSWTFKSQIRSTNCQEGTLLAEFTIDIDIINSTITLNLSDIETQQLEEGTYFWDLLAEINGCDVNLIQGKVKVLCTVTEK